VRVKEHHEADDKVEHHDKGQKKTSKPSPYVKGKKHQKSEDSEEESEEEEP
jgi:hypothetical protein